MTSCARLLSPNCVSSTNNEPQPGFHMLLAQNVNPRVSPCIVFNNESWTNSQGISGIMSQNIGHSGQNRRGRRLAYEGLLVVWGVEEGQEACEPMQMDPVQPHSNLPLHSSKNSSSMQKAGEVWRRVTYAISCFESTWPISGQEDFACKSGECGEHHRWICAWWKFGLWTWRPCSNLLLAIVFY